MKRVLTSVALVPAAVWTVLYSDWRIFLAVVVLVSCLAFHEYARITGAFAPLGYVAGVLLLVAPPREASLILILTGLAAMAVAMGADNLTTGVSRAGALAMGVLYVFGAWKTAVLLRDEKSGAYWLLFGLMVNWVGDTGAYYVGKNFGRRKLAPVVSPGKTWEGAVASGVAGILLGVVYLPWAIPGLGMVTAGIVALAANAAGQIGDLAESALKRGAGVKDSGTLLPGHGGVLDRMDSTMFSVPVLYLIVSFLSSMGLDAH